MTAQEEQAEQEREVEAQGRHESEVKDQEGHEGEVKAQGEQEKPLNFVRVGTPKLRKDPIGLLFVISEVHKRIDHGEGRRKFSGRRIPHTLYYIVSANKAANGKFHLQAMYGRTQNLVRNGGSLRPDVLVVPRFVIRGI